MPHSKDTKTTGAEIPEGETTYRGSATSDDPIYKMPSMILIGGFSHGQKQPTESMPPHTPHDPEPVPKKTKATSRNGKRRRR